MLFLKANIQYTLGRIPLAIAHSQQAYEAYAAAGRKGLLKGFDHDDWRRSVVNMGKAYYASHQLEPAKQCSLRVLA